MITTWIYEYEECSHYQGEKQHPDASHSKNSCHETETKERILYRK